MKSSQFLKTLDDSKIIAAIQEAEASTTGEIRLVVSAKKDSDPIAAGWKAFERLKMRDTQNRNAVLLYLCPEVQRFAILGDKGIHEKAGDQLWEAAASALHDGLGKHRLTETLAEAITMIGTALKTHFPSEGANPNELPDTVDREHS